MKFKDYASEECYLSKSILLKRKQILFMVTFSICTPFKKGHFFQGDLHLLVQTHTEDSRDDKSLC